MQAMAKLRKIALLALALLGACATRRVALDLPERELLSPTRGVARRLMPDSLPLEYKFTSDPAPVQAEGTIAGHAFYFRARGETWAFTVAERPDDDPTGLTEMDAAMGRAWYRSGTVPGRFAASWMPRDQAVSIIKACAEAYVHEHAS